MKKIICAIALLTSVSVAFASSSFKGNPNYKHQAGKSAVKSTTHVHHTHIQVPCDHYGI